MTKVAIWPLSFCDGSTECFLDCFLAGKVWPMVLIHLALFYGSVLLHKLLKIDKRNPKDSMFKDPFQFAHHVPAIGMALPIAILSYQAMIGELLQGTMVAKYSEIAGTDYQDHVSEGMAWFQTFLAVDTVIMLLHRLGSMEMYVHHFIFAVGLVSQVGGGHCCCAWAVAAALQQELSTPFLNVFLLLRGFRGLDCPLTQGSFVVFALTFFWCRPIFATYVAVDWSWTEFYVADFSSYGFTVCYKTYEMVMLGAVIWGSLSLQYFWTLTIGKNLLKGLGCIKGKLKEKDAARLSANEEGTSEEEEESSAEESESYVGSVEPMMRKK